MTHTGMPDDITCIYEKIIFHFQFNIDHLSLKKILSVQSLPMTNDKLQMENYKSFLKAIVSSEIVSMH
jgi:hypothetical protein